MNETNCWDDGCAMAGEWESELAALRAQVQELEAQLAQNEAFAAEAERRMIAAQEDLAQAQLALRPWTPVVDGVYRTAHGAIEVKDGTLWAATYNGYPVELGDLRLCKKGAENE